MTLNKKLHNLIGEVLGLSPETISDATAPENTPQWDSFNGLMLAAELEKASGVQFTMDDITSVKNVADIKGLLNKYQITYEC